MAEGEEREDLEVLLREDERFPPPEDFKQQANFNDPSIYDEAEKDFKAWWERWARWLGHRPWRAVAAGGIGVALLTFPLTQIRLGLPARNWFPPQSESGQGLAELKILEARWAAAHGLDDPRQEQD